MKESDEKDKDSQNQDREDWDRTLEEIKKQFKAQGVEFKLEPMEDEYIVMLNPPKSLVEKMRKAKQEEAAKKKK